MSPMTDSGEGAEAWQVEDEEGYERASAELKRRFGAWATARGLELDGEEIESLLHYKWGYLDGHLTNWRRSDLYEIYLELHPAKVVVEPEELGAVLDEARAFIEFLAGTGLLDGRSEPAEALLDYLVEIDGEFRSRMADTSRYSFGKRLMSRANAEGVSIGDSAGVAEFIARFNALPASERDAVLGPTLAARAPNPRAMPRGTPPRAAPCKRGKRRNHR